MSTDSPFFFMREFSNEELAQLLMNKIKELKDSKSEIERLNKTLQENMAKLEEVQQQLLLQNESLEKKVKRNIKSTLSKKSLSTKESKTILVADDAQFMRKVLKDMINEHCPVSKIYEASDGVEAVTSYQKNKPDLVTLDINMPRADGIQVLRSIKKIDDDAKVVMMTTTGQKKIIDEAIGLGASDYIIKPFKQTQVKTILNKILNPTKH